MQGENRVKWWKEGWTEVTRDYRSAYKPSFYSPCSVIVPEDAEVELDLKNIFQMFFGDVYSLKHHTVE